MDQEFCCEDFQDMFEEGIIELDNNECRSVGWYTREKYVILCHSDEKLTSAHIYMKFCPRCGKSVSTDLHG